MAAVDTAAAVADVAQVGVAIGLVGGAVLGVWVLVRAFQWVRDVAGVGGTPSLEAWSIGQGVQDDLYGDGAPLEAQDGSPWLGFGDGSVDAISSDDPWDGYTAEDDARDRAAAGLGPQDDAEQ